MKLERIKTIGVDVTLSLSKGLRWLAHILPFDSAQGRIALYELRTQSMISALKTSTFLLMFVLFFSSCDRSRIFEENQTIPDNVWTNDNVLKFTVDVVDSISPTNFYVNVRNADGYPYSNLFLFVKTIFPNNKISNDTLECILADDKGQWLGSGMGDIYDNQIPFKQNVRFPIKGTYTFEIRHGMRVDKIPLIMDMGLRIEKAK